MYSYIARRLVFGALTVVGVSIMVFVIMRILPGDPLVAIFGPEGLTKLTEEQRASYMRDLGLLDPLWVQYLGWAGDVFTGNFGRSFFRSESVAEMIARRGPLTAEIALIAVLISWLVGIPVAIVSALKPNTVADSIARFISILFIAVPGFWIGMLIVLGLLFWFGYRAPLTGASLFSDPLWVQYLRWVNDIVRGDFGRSFFRSESVADMILRRGPLTAEIALFSVMLSWLVGIPVAIVSALKPNTAADSVVRFFSILFLAVPGFWVGMLIVLALLFWFGYRAPMAGASLFADPVVNLQLVIGPAIVLGLGQAAYIARMGRSSLLEVIREDYVRTARAKGLNSRLVIAWHALPNALLPVITLSGVLMGLVLAGSIPVERAFGTPGLGYSMFQAVYERDVFVMQNLVFLYSVVFVLLNIVVDLTIAFLDPRIRLR